MMKLGNNSLKTFPYVNKQLKIIFKTFLHDYMTKLCNIWRNCAIIRSNRPLARFSYNINSYDHETTLVVKLYKNAYKVLHYFLQLKAPCACLPMPTAVWLGLLLLQVSGIKKVFFPTAKSWHSFWRDTRYFSLLWLETNYPHSWQDYVSLSNAAEAKP